MVMKVLTIVLVVLAVLFAISQVWAQSQVSGIEEYPYTILKDMGDVEIRRYEQANFIYATMDASSYEQNSGRGFGILAGYIFGGNERQQKIAMTSPVEMEMDEKITMKFLIPSQYKMEDMPKPDDVQVQFKTEAERTMAAITFGGFADDAKIEHHKEKLLDRLAEEGIAHTGQWSFMGYDPPFKLYNRRNEVVVELE